MIINGDSFEELKKMEDNSVDSIITDPPYDIGFMNKGWDKNSLITNIDFWKECLRVLKPGGHLLSFGHSRTSHRMVMAVEEAGFEIRDTIMWMYGCLTQDTEVLTKNGWKLYDEAVKEEIAVYDTKKDFYKWEKPARWFVYPVNEDTVYRIRSDKTDQLVSRNHNCLVERDGKLVFTKAEDLLSMERMPLLPDTFSLLQESEGEVLQQGMQWTSARYGVEETRSQGTNRLDRRKLYKLQRKNEWSKQSKLEGRHNLQKQERLLSTSKNKVCKMSTGIHTNGKKRWLCNGVSFGNGSTTEQTTNKDRMRPSHRSQPREQLYNKLNVIQEQLGSQEVRMGTTYTTDLATITTETYSGIIFCPNTSTGAFVARRNGKVFVTGNSGFPKSHNVAIAIDKKLGKMGHRGVRSSFNGQKTIHGEDIPAAVGVEQHQAISDEAKEWQGWGTALKPSYEPVTMARKPLEGTVADNVLEWGTGAINIDECRVGTEKITTNGKGNKFVDNLPHGQRTGEKVLGVNKEHIGRFPANIILDSEAGDLLDSQTEIKKEGKQLITRHDNQDRGYREEYVNGDKTGSKGAVVNYHDGGGASRFFKSIDTELCASIQQQEHKEPQGRFPANIILDSEVGKLLDEQSGFSKSSKRTEKYNKDTENRSGYTPVKSDYREDNTYSDSGGASRFFYCAKVSRKERELNCDSLENAIGQKGNGKNNHPTVKPVKLMEYLVKLITRQGGVVLDPFAGSGSTGVAAKNLGMKYILIEREAEYCDIIKARLKD